MIDFKKCGLVAVMICYVALNVNAQYLKQVAEKEISSETISKVFFICKGKKIADGDTLKKYDLDSIKVDCSWNKDCVEKIIFENPVYIPSKKEIKNGGFSFVVFPKATTSYRYTIYLKDGEKILSTHKIIIHDDKGNEIKEKSKIE